MRLALRNPLNRSASARALALLAIGVLAGGAGLLGWLLTTSPIRDDDQFALAVAISVIVVGVPTLGLALYLGGLAFSVSHPGVGVRTVARRAMLALVGTASVVAGVYTLVASGPGFSMIALFSLGAAAFYVVHRELRRTTEGR